jgi:hypothetical protein
MSSASSSWASRPVIHRRPTAPLQAASTNTTKVAGKRKSEDGLPREVPQEVAVETSSVTTHGWVARGNPSNPGNPNNTSNTAAAAAAAAAGDKPNLHYNAKKQRKEWTNVQPASQVSIFGALDAVKDAGKIASRGKQVSYGKNTLGYERYLAALPKDRRKMTDPWTPEHKANIPNKRWQGLLKTWRASLHKWDPEGLLPTTKTCAEAEDLIRSMSGVSSGAEVVAADENDAEKMAATAAGLVVAGVAAGGGGGMAGALPVAAKKALSWGERNDDSEDDDVYASLAKGEDGLDSDSDDDLL